jgi:hypothetical protein
MTLPSIHSDKNITAEIQRLYPIMREENKDISTDELRIKKTTLYTQLCEITHKIMPVDSHTYGKCYDYHHAITKKCTVHPLYPEFSRLTCEVCVYAYIIDRRCAAA